MSFTSLLSDITVSAGKEFFAKSQTLFLYRGKRNQAKHKTNANKHVIVGAFALIVIRGFVNLN